MARYNRTSIDLCPRVTMAAHNALEVFDDTDEVNARLRSFSQLPFAHPVFNAVADRLGLLPAKLCEEVATFYTVVTGFGESWRPFNGRVCQDDPGGEAGPADPCGRKHRTAHPSCRHHVAMAEPDRHLQLHVLPGIAVHQILHKPLPGGSTILQLSGDLRPH